MTFKDFALSDPIVAAVTSMDFTAPTPIQEEVIPAFLEGTGDIVALAQTGTGKTAAFALPILENLRDASSHIGALVLCPTRELAIQITKEVRHYSANLPHIEVDVVYGGTGYSEQIRALKRGVHILVATPGRLLDLINKGKVDLDRLNYLVLDEADIMLNMGFKEELDAILESVPVERRTVLLSATMPREVERIASTYMEDPQYITIGERNAVASSVEHSYFVVHNKEKYAALKRLIDFHPDMYAIIFCRTKRATQEIADQLITDGYSAEALHGDLSQVQRELVMNKFRKKNIHLLIATDIAARGLDVQDLSHVIHYDLPDETDIYTHRSGRTGRAGKLGNSYAIVGVRETRRLKYIEKAINRTIGEGAIPGEEDIFTRQLVDFVDRLAEVEVNEEKIAPYLPVLREKLSAINGDDLIRKIIALQFNRLLDYYHELPDLTPVRDQEKMHQNPSADYAKGRKRKTVATREGKNNWRAKKYKGSHDGHYVEIGVNLGKRDRVNPPNLIGLVNQATRNRDINIGNIKIDTSWSNMQVEKEHAGEVIQALNGFTYKGRTIKASIGNGSRKKR